MTITWFFLLQLLLACAATIYRDCLRTATNELSNDTWNACLHPGEQR